MDRDTDQSAEFAEAFGMTDEQSQQAEADRVRREAMERQRYVVEGLMADRLRDAIHARENSGIEQVWIDAEDQYNGYDEVNPPMTGAMVVKDQSKAARGPGKRSTVFLNITRPKTDAAVSRVTEMTVPSDDKPWEIGPTPIPELDRAADGNDERPIQLADGGTATATAVAKAAKELARQKSARMADQIEDWLVESNVYAEWRKVIRDAGRIGSGVIKGPFPMIRKDKKYQINEQTGEALLQIAERLAPTSRRIDAWDLFPDPSSGDNIHAGAYIFERDYLTGRRLRELAAVPGYDKDRIAELLKEGPQRRARSDRYYREKQGETPDFDTGTFEVYYYYGDIPPAELLAGGFEVHGLTHDEQGQAIPEDEIDKALALTTVPIVVTMVNERVVRISMNPLETGEFPFDVFPWEPVDGQPWGRGVPHKMAVAQRMLNASVRALLENAGMSAGPQIVVAKDIVTPWDGVYTIQGRKGWHFTPNEQIDDVRKAFASVVIDSAQQQLQAIIQFALQMADELSSLPLLLQGAVGSAPDTVGGMAMLQANATSPLKAIAKMADDTLFEPQIKRYYAWGMQDPNVSADAKGDFQCKARASTALIERDIAAQALPALMPLSKDPAFGLDPEKVARLAVKGQRISHEEIALTDDQKKAMADAAQQQPQDPRIAAAQIQAQSRAEDRQANSQEKALDRQHQGAIAELEFEIQAMEYAGQKEISFEQLKAMLAAKAIDARTKQDLQVRELSFATGPGEGRGV